MGWPRAFKTYPIALNSEFARMAAATLASPSRLAAATSCSVSGAQAIATARARVAGSELLMSSALAFLARQASRASYDLSIFDVRLPSPVVLPHALSSRTRRTRAVRMQSLGLTLGRKAGLRRDYHFRAHFNTCSKASSPAPFYRGGTRDFVWAS